MDDEFQLVTPRQAANLLAIGIRTLDQMARDGRLQKYKIGVMTRYRLSDVLALIEPATERNSRRVGS